MLELMPELTLPQALDLALQHHQAGQLAEAESIYRQILAVDPNQAEALHYLGIVAHQVGRHEEALELIGKALEVRPGWAEALCNLGEALRKLGKLQAAVANFQRALELVPDFAAAHCNLGNALNELGLWEEAISAYRKAIALKSDFVQAHINLSVTLMDHDLVDQAIAAYRELIALKPDLAEAHYDLGNALKVQGQLAQASQAYRQAIALKPSFAKAYNNLAIILKDNGQLDEASATFRQALALEPDYAEAHYNLGLVLKDQGQLDQALEANRQAVALMPEDARFHSCLVFTQNYHPELSAAAIAAAEQRWYEQHAKLLEPLIRRHPHERSPERRLRIGYVSPDLRSHPVGHFLLPLWENHDRKQYEIFAYAQVANPDEMTARLRSLTDGWRSTVGLADVELADLIRADQIDILVDLAIHTVHNRLLVFAQKPAPVQVNYLAYAGSSGLPTMDYRLSDPYLDPPGSEESIYCEQTVRLPETYWCYQPAKEAFLSETPRNVSDPIRFGCLNNFCKINDPLVASWAKILQAVSGARLLLHTAEGNHRQQLLDRFMQRGIEAERIEFVARMPYAEYFQTYQSLDISLDTSPYAGGTTTCDSLWMGVPVVTLAGERAVGRGGVSILNNVGLPELIAKTPEEYIQIAVALANDRERLRKLRASLRARMQASPLMNAPRFARNVETAYREMWRGWCQKQKHDQ